MQKKRGLYSLFEWNRAVARQEVSEPKFSLEYPSSGVSCPNRNSISGGFCGSHLRDIPLYKGSGDHLKKKVYCDVCEWDGWRAVARTNGE